jgi:DNA-binding SARP family transcriptional activator
MTAQVMPVAQLFLLGGFDLRLNDKAVTLPPSAQRLISFLALTPRALMRVFVAGNLWAEVGEAQANSSLRSTLWRLQEKAQLIETTSTHVRLAPSVQTDVAHAAEVSKRLIEDEAPPDPTEVLALSHAGELLPGWYDDWLIVERERVRQRRLHALEEACRRLAEAGRFSDAIEAGLAAVAIEPLRESGHAAVIQVHLCEGNLIEASRQYEQLRDLLREHLGTRPSKRVLELLHN